MNNKYYFYFSVRRRNSNFLVVRSEDEDDVSSISGIHIYTALMVWITHAEKLRCLGYRGGYPQSLHMIAVILDHP